MRIPPSVIVMSLLTAVPFGLAVKDTLGSKHERTAADDDGDELPGGSLDDDRARAVNAKLEQEMAEREAQHEAEETARRTARLHEVYGEQKGTMGSLFAGVTLGNADALLAAMPKFEKFAEDTGIDINVDGMNPNVVTVYLGTTSDHACEELTSQLDKAWGPSAAGSVYEAGEAWSNDAAHQIAFLDKREACKLTFVKTTTVAELFAKGTAGLAPLWAINASADRLDKVLPPGANREDPDARIWELPGIGKTTEATRVEAGLENNKVTSVVISGTTDDTTFMSLVAQLTSLYGAPKADGDQVVWNRPHMTLSHTGQSWLLVVGG